MRFLDSHLHLWAPSVLDYTWLRGPLAFEFSDLELRLAAVEGASAEASVFVQAECAEAQFLDEVRWVEGIAAKAGVRAIIAGARLDRGVDTTAHLDALDAHRLVRGVRHLLQDERAGFATSAPFLAGARQVAERGWTFDACVRAAQLPDVTALARAVPTLRIVLDHLGKPEVGTATLPVAPADSWRRDISELARHPQVSCKLSGLPAEAAGDWSAEQMIPFLDAAADAFGPERLMWGSDWPVSVIGPAEPGDEHAPADGSATYQYTARSRWAHVVADWAAMRGHDVDGILWANAVRFYGLDDAKAPAEVGPRRGLLARLFGWD